MRKLAMAVITSLCALTIVGCNGVSGTSPSSEATQSSESASSGSPGAAPAEQGAIKTSPDKYTWYIKNYVGMNAALVGYSSLDGFRRDRYGAGTLRLVFVSPDGTFVDPGDEEDLKNYYVVAQSYAPNTEIKYLFPADIKGKEYDNIVYWQSIDELVLSVNKVGDKSDTTVGMTKIQPAPDKYSFYVRDYVGRNLAECGYVSMAHKLTDAYGTSYLYFDITADDGSYIELPDSSSDDASEASKDALSQYVVTAQSVAPNTPVSLTYGTDINGEEYDNLVDTKSLDSIALTVAKIAE